MRSIQGAEWHHRASNRPIAAATAGLLGLGGWLEKFFGNVGIHNTVQYKLCSLITELSSGYSTPTHLSNIWFINFKMYI